jgi:hypothetical protein
LVEQRLDRGDLRGKIAGVVTAAAATTTSAAGGDQDRCACENDPYSSSTRRQSAPDVQRPAEKSSGTG